MMMLEELSGVIDLNLCPIGDDQFRERCRGILAAQGALVLPGFLTSSVIDAIRQEGESNKHIAFYTVDDHNIYLKPHDDNFPDNHARNRLINSSKGCITTDQIPHNSALLQLYKSAEFRAFLCSVLGESQLHEYADQLSSVNLHYASEGQELGWHFDNSSFAITLLIQKPEAGGVFEYVKDLRDADSGDMNYAAAEEVLDGEIPVKTLKMEEGALILFRGRNTIHRVTPTQGDLTRMLVVLAYNTEPGVALSESARMTFYGRLD